MSKNIQTAINTWDNKPVTIEQALVLRDSGFNGFKCDDCGDSVRAHKQSTTGAKAHFEHHEANPLCKY
ncbi:transposase [Vibrio crassostreae]|nr:transposase [Vibrio crassostreae]CAK2335574.1 transposase [Vibrio crassostreae]CAK2504065.1 transposase [Vibrio crassostreae]CAK2909047.1 transposase [Vibrio crassostreae]